MNRPSETAELMCPPESAPKMDAKTMMPNPNDAATIMRLGLGNARVTIAQPQHRSTNRCMARNSAKQARWNFPSISSHILKSFPRKVMLSGHHEGFVMLLFPIAPEYPNANSSNLRVLQQLSSPQFRAAWHAWYLLWYMHTTACTVRHTQS